MEYHSVIKKKEILLLEMTWMALQGIMPREISQRNKYHMISLMWNQKKKKNPKQMKQEKNQILTYREQMDGWGWVGEIKGIKRYKLPRSKSWRGEVPHADTPGWLCQRSGNS